MCKKEIKIIYNFISLLMGCCICLLIFAFFYFCVYFCFKGNKNSGKRVGCLHSYYTAYCCPPNSCSDTGFRLAPRQGLSCFLLLPGLLSGSKFCFSKSLLYVVFTVLSIDFFLILYLRYFDV